MERNIAVYNCDGELLQWIDQKRFLRLVDVGRVARVVKTRTGRVRRITLVHMPGEWKPSLLSDYKGTKYSFRQHLDDGRRCYRLRALGDNHNGRRAGHGRHLREFHNCGACSARSRNRTVALERLVPYARNARTHTAGAADDPADQDPAPEGRLTETRPSSAALAKTIGSSRPSSGTVSARLKSNVAARRSAPAMMACLRSASA
jgi:hypothetical protein